MTLQDSMTNENDVRKRISIGFDSLDGGDYVEVTVVAAIVAVIVLFARVSTVRCYRSS